ncbi:calponin-1 isoform X2 [Chanodichthys erythropterus]|uniref:calponin-1 isoform X2 n=1 Tax=Chanodichthys erythropterus TaxID=933992 RepID=UPI00351E22B9
MSGQFKSGPTFGLSAEVKSKLAHKYDPQKEEELRMWISEVTGRKLPENFMEGLKDGVVLCELINTLQPGSVRKINNSPQNWHQAKSKGFHCKYDMGVKYAEKQQRRFAPEKLKEGRNIIGLQMGTNKFASQKGMTSYGTRRHLYDPKTGMENPLDQSTISLQMGTNKGASQAGMTAPGTKRQIFDKKLDMEMCDTSIVSLQMGTNKVASQTGMTVYGLPRQVYDSKYCSTPNDYINNGQDSEMDGYQYSD